MHIQKKSAGSNLVGNSNQHLPGELTVHQAAINTESKADEEYISHLVSIVEFSEDAIISKTFDGTIKSWNKGSEKMFGYTSAEMIGKNITAIIPPEFISEEKNILDRVSNNETVDPFETVRVKKNAERIYVSLMVSPLKDRAGNIIGASTIGRDITFRKKSLAELINANHELDFQSEEKLIEVLRSNKVLKKKMFETGMVGFIFWDADGEITDANDRFLEMTGYSKSDLQEKRISWKMMTPPEYLALDQRALEQIALTGVCEQFEKEYIRKDGSRFPVILGATSIEGNNPEKGVAYVMDITERKKAQKEIKNYRDAIYLSSIVAFTDQKGIIKHVNENFCKISKYSAEELIGQDHRIVNSGYHPKSFIKNLWATIAKGKMWKGELCNKAKDGTIYWVDTTIVPFLDEHGKPFQYVAIRSDITAQKKSQEELRMANRELAFQNQEKEKRAAELLIINDELIQAESRLKEVNTELEAFSYSVSHDLWSPLRAVNSYAQILTEDYANAIDADGMKILENIRYNTKKMGALIDELLSFSRLGRKDIDRVEIDMNELIQSVADDFKRTTNHHATIRAGLMPAVKADYTLLRQVIVNLLSNAIKYSAKKEQPEVDIFVELHNGKPVFAVKDNGAGFDMRFEDKLFGVFQRLHSEKEFEGNGVGLAIVHRIIAKHGGRVWAQGKENEGATFYFTLE